MNFDIISTFQNHCDKLVNSLTLDINNFKNLDEDFDRIKYLYDHAKNEPLPLSTSGKSYEKALQYKVEGNKFYEKKELDKAIESYNCALVACPQNKGEEKELVAVTIGNRSAVLLEKDLTQECLEDINYLINFHSYPKHLQHKIYLRKGKCCTALGRHPEGIAALNLAMTSLAHANLSPGNSKNKLKEISDALEEIKMRSNDANMQLAMPSITKLTFFTPNYQYPAVNDFVEFDEDLIQGRFARAKRDIEPGCIIAEEDPHCLAISVTCSTMNCANCAKSTVNPIPCGFCKYVVFCCKTCLDDANYHKIECKIIHSLYESGASINCIMALRIITQKVFSFFWERKDTLQHPILSNIYEGSDYGRLYHLCTHSGMRPKGEFLHYTFMAIYLLRLLKLTNYFPFESKDDILKNEECFIGSLLLRHLQILQFNAHELSELRNLKTAGGNELNYYTCHLGGAIYPTLALFNHSCEPGVIRYNKGRKMILRAIKLIRAGDYIYDNYGPIYSSEEKIVRLRILRGRYWFDCPCIACKNNWPLFHDMDDNFLNVLCLKCKATNVVSKNTELPVLNCWKCRAVNTLMPILMKLMSLDRMTQDAEKSFKTGNFDKTVLLFCEILKIYYKYLSPPFQDLIKVQQRIRTCMLHDGNKELCYISPDKLPDF